MNRIKADFVADVAEFIAERAREMEEVELSRGMWARDLEVEIERAGRANMPSHTYKRLRFLDDEEYHDAVIETGRDIMNRAEPLLRAWGYSEDFYDPWG